MTIYSDIDPEIQDLISNTDRLVREHRTDKLYEVALANLMKGWDRPKANVVVAGEISAGKTTLINALLAETFEGRELLPTDSRAWTSTAVQIEYAPSFTAQAIVHSPQAAAPLTVDLKPEDLSTYLTVQGTKQLQRHYGRGVVVRHVTVGAPNARLKRGIGLLDTPGVGGLTAAHFNRARAALANADAVLFVSDPAQPISETERRFLADAIERLTLCFVVLPHRDVQPNPDGVLENDRAILRDAQQWSKIVEDPDRAAELAELFDSVTILSVSSRYRLQAEHRGVQERAQLIGLSNIGMLENALEGEVLGRVGALHRRNVIRLCLVIAKETGRDCAERLQLLESLKEGEQKLEELEEVVAKWVGHGGDTWKRSFTAKTTLLARELREIAKSRADSLSSEYRVKLGSLKLNELAEALEEIDAAAESCLVEMLEHGRERISEAVQDVRGLLAEDSLDGPLSAWLDQRDIEGRHPAPEVMDTPGGVGFEEARAGLVGWMVGGSVGAAVAAGTGLILLPALLPVALAAVFARHTWSQKRRARAVTEAIDHLNKQCSYIVNEVVQHAEEAADGATKVLEDQIALALDSERHRIARLRETVEKYRAMAGEEESRNQALTALRERVTQCEQLVNTAKTLGARLPN
jgi:tRNA U34 5-carboxymethylaminomethyl modifying GTPase MnmE/TrmE